MVLKYTRQKEKNNNVKALKTLKAQQCRGGWGHRENVMVEAVLKK